MTIGETGRNLTTRLTEHKQATKKGDLNNNIAENHLKTSHALDWDSTMCLTYSTDYYQRITLKSWFTNLEQTALLSTSSHTLQIFTRQETVTPRLLLILQPISLHNLYPHMSSPPITSHIYQRLLYLMTNQIAHQGF